MWAVDRQDDLRSPGKGPKVDGQSTEVRRELCLRCKGGKLLCGKSRCPITAQTSVHSDVARKLRKDIASPSPPGFFVGWKGYPKVSLGPMGLAVPHEDPSFLDDPARWYGATIQEVVGFRSLLVRSRESVDIHAARDPPATLRDYQDLVLSSRPVDVELHLRQVPRFHIAFSAIAQPMGPSAELKSFDLVGNPSVPRAADKVTGDTDLKAEEGVANLFDAGMDVYHVQKVLSAGLLGRGKDRTLVPTRWAITATDDIVGRDLADRLRDLPELDEVLLFSNEYMGNHYEIILMPGPLEFEHLESWEGGSVWGAGDGWTVVQEYEPTEGRTSYAVKQGGGYYAARLAVYEAMVRMGRQAVAVALREIDKTYYLPVGVWEVRENVRRALQNAPERFPDLKTALATAAPRTGTGLTRWVRNSAILKNRLYQRTLTSFF